MHNAMRGHQLSERLIVGHTSCLRSPMSKEDRS